jgi:tripartite-type tricarboxylate transporter receptor subunit TctC
MGVPDAIIKKLEGVFDKAKRDPSFTKALEEFEVAAGTLSGKEYSALWRSQYDEIGKVIKTLGLQEK